MAPPYVSVNRTAGRGGTKKGGPADRPDPLPRSLHTPQVVNELPHPQPPVAFGFLNVKPEPIIVVT